MGPLAGAPPAEDRPAFHITPPDWTGDPALQAVLHALPGARLVGGCVRDALAGRTVADVDLATPLPPDQVAHALQAAGLRVVPTGLQHGTVTAVSGGRGFEVTTLRRDESTDGRHAVVAWTVDWREDAARRDFTINAMSMQAGSMQAGSMQAGSMQAAGPSQEWAVWDYFGGAVDLAAGRVRFVGDAAARIAEDYLRILRFFRFHARYGSGPPDPAALAALQGGVPGLSRLSPERVWSELKRILATPDPRGAVALMADLGILAALLPPPLDAARLDRLVGAGAPADPLLRLAALAPTAGAALAEALRMATAERDRLLALHDPAPAPAWDDAALRRLLADAPPGAVPGRAWLAQADAADSGDGEWPALHARLSALPRPRFPLAGRDALALGMKPGPEVGERLAAVRAWWVAGGCVAGAAACRAQLAAGKDAA